MAYSMDGYDLDETYPNPYGDTREERFERLRDKEIAGYRAKTVRSGPMLEVETYPFWNCRNGNRAAKQKESRAAQRNLNNKNAVKNVVRLINTNFTEDDIWATYTYSDARLPPTVEAAQKEMAKYVKRLKTYAKKRGFAELKYIYVTEFENDPKKGKHRVHHHLVTNFPDRDIAEEKWKGGARTTTRRLQPDRFEYEGMARYITKDPRGNKRYVASKNLKKPIITTADHKFTRRGVERLLRGGNAQSKLEKLYKGYEFLDLKAFTSDYVSGAYVYVRMRRRQ